MATWTLSELDLNSLSVTINSSEGESTVTYTPPLMPCVIVNSGASYEPIPFYGWINAID